MMLPSDRDLRRLEELTTYKRKKGIMFAKGAFAPDSTSIDNNEVTHDGWGKHWSVPDTAITAVLDSVSKRINQGMNTPSHIKDLI